MNEHWFETLPQARAVIRAWVQDYNEVRPHSSIGRMPQGASRACIASKLATQVQLKPQPPTQLPCNPGLSPNDW